MAGIEDEMSTADWMQRRQQDVGNAAADYAAGLDATAASIRNGQYLSAPTTDSVRALGADARGEDAAARAAAIRRGDKAMLTDKDIAGIIFNETRSLNGQDIQKARENVAHAIMSADETWGTARSKHAKSAPSAVASVPKVEAGTYQSAIDAVAAARAQRAKGVDPTGGALNFNFRKPIHTGELWDRSEKTRLGPFNNSYPTDKLPSTGVYSSTY